MPYDSNKVSFSGDCNDDCQSRNQQLVMAWHNRYGFFSFSDYQWLGIIQEQHNPPPYSHGTHTDGYRWIDADLFSSLDIDETFDWVNGRYVRTQLRLKQLRVTKQMNLLTGVESIIDTDTIYLTGWLPHLTSEEHHNPPYPSQWRAKYTHTFFLGNIVTTATEQKQEVWIREDRVNAEGPYYDPFHGGEFWLPYIESRERILTYVSSYLSNNNTYEHTLAICDELLNGPWTDVDVGGTVDWNNQIYFDDELAHSGYYHVYYDSDGNKMIRQIKYLPMIFGDYGNKKNLWIGYMVGYTPMASTIGRNPQWILPGKYNEPYELVTKTRGRIKNAWTANIKLNRSNKIYDSPYSVLPGVVPYSDIGVDDGKFYVFSEDEVDAGELVPTCELISIINSPAYDGNKQGWYHLYM